MFHLYLTVAYLYVLWRFVFPLPASRAVRAGVGVTLLLVSKYHLLNVVFFGNMWAPELPFVAVLLLGWAFCAFVLLTVFLLLLDLSWLLQRAFRRGGDRQATQTRWHLGAACAAAVLSAVGVSYAIDVPEVHRVDLEVSGLPPQFDGFRLVQLSDLHLSPLFPATWSRAVVDRTNALAPDLILITGDLIDGSTEARRSDVAPLGDLRAAHGVFGITGNHEYYFDYGQWRPVFTRLGIQMLDNAHAVVTRNGARLTVAGITDAAAASYGHASPDLATALRGAPADARTILMSHRPNGAAANAAQGVDVQLSGHTHGGMVRGLDLVARPANEGLVSRGYRVGSMQLYVSNGTGLWMGFPIRLGVPSETTEFRLRPAARQH